jgi:hypothetical protein
MSYSWSRRLLVWLNQQGAGIKISRLALVAPSRALA